VFTYSFCNATAGVVIPNSQGALLCALSYVDDDTITGWCNVHPSGGAWVAQTGAGCGENACAAVCIK
jgi:hypothetical protein